MVIQVPPSSDPDELLDRLELSAIRTTLVINGGTSKYTGGQAQEIANALRAAVSELANWPAPAILSGGTDAGIFHLLGEVVEERAFPGPVIGVVPAGKVRPVDEDDGDGDDGDGDVGDGDDGDADRVEPHHTHVVAVEGGEWGIETPVMLGLSDALRRRGPVAVIVGGGGDNARREVAGHEAAGRRLLVLEGTGRLSDELAAEDGSGREVIYVADGERLTRRLRSIFEVR